MKKATLTPQQKEAIKIAKKMANKAISAVMQTTFDTNIRNARFHEIKAIEADAIAKIMA